MSQPILMKSEFKFTTISADDWKQSLSIARNRPNRALATIAVAELIGYPLKESSFSPQGCGGKHHIQRTDHSTIHFHMKVTQVSSLGFKLNKSVPETNEEYERLANRGPNAACEDATASTLYRSTFPVFRDIFLHGQDAVGDQPAIVGLDKITGVERKTKDGTKKNADGTFVQVWDETEGAYWKRLKATLNLSDEEADTKFAAEAQVAMDAAPFDPSIRVAAPSGPKAISKTIQAIADEAVNSGKADALAAALSNKLGKVVASDAKSLATAISENEAIKRKAREAALKSEYSV